MIAVVLALALASSPSVAGKWGAEGEVFFDLKEGGKGKMDDESITWAVVGDKLKITSSDGEEEELPFRLKGDKLIITLEGSDLTLHRVDSAAPAKEKPATDDDRVIKLLTSRPWCGATSRLEFRNGTWTSTEKDKQPSEGHWLVKSHELFMSHPPKTLQPVRAKLELLADAPGFTLDGLSYRECPALNAP